METWLDPFPIQNDPKTRLALTQFFSQLSCRIYFGDYTVRPEKAEI
jgi:hypothetical protein